MENFSRYADGSLVLAKEPQIIHKIPLALLNFSEKRSKTNLTKANLV